MKICIDAGHNIKGHDTGAIGVGGANEGEITFDIAYALSQMLKGKGHDIVLTRPTKDTVLGTNLATSLSERARISNEGGCDLFISLHCNSATPSAKGTEALISGRGGEAEKAAKRMVDAISLNLATANRGVKVDTEYLGNRLYVLHNTTAPAVLCELAFISNTEDAQKLLTKGDAFAKAIASAVGGDTPSFTDIEGHWAREVILSLAKEGIVSGYADGTFRPDAPITRGEAVALVYKATRCR